jgi:hypothetical protein
MKRRPFLLLVLTSLVSAALACGQTPTPSPTPIPTQGPTPTPLPVQAPGWEGITLQTLCLEVEQSFPDAPEDRKEVVTPKIGETTQRVLSRLGLRFAEADCDADLLITMTGQASSANYLGAGRCYEGAEVSGEIQLSASGRTPLTVTMSRSRPLPSAIASSYCAKEPYEAPFPLIWPQALLDGLSQLWGPHVPLSTIRDDEWMISSAALQVLAGMGPVEGAVPAIIQVLESDEWFTVRASAARALGAMGAEEGVIPTLIGVIEDEDEDSSVRMGAIGALGVIGPEATEAIPAIIHVLLKENDVVLSPLAAETLGQIGPQSPEVIPALIQALEGEWHSIRQSAAKGLGMIGPQAMEAVPNLIHALEDEAEVVREASVEALIAITGQDLGADAAAWQAWWQSQK